MKKLLLVAILVLPLLYVGGCDQIQAVLDSCDTEEDKTTCSNA